MFEGMLAGGPPQAVPAMVEIRHRRTDGILLYRGEEDTLCGALLSRLNLRGANLSGASMRGADLSRADLGGADLSGADLSGADLSGALLWDADLSRADLSGATLTGAVLLGADLTGARSTTSTVWPEGFDPASQVTVERSGGDEQA